MPKGGRKPETWIYLRCSAGRCSRCSSAFSFSGWPVARRPTGYAINPARDLGPRIAHAILPISGKGSSDWSYAWLPVVAPIVGGIAGAALYTFVGF